MVMGIRCLLVAAALALQGCGGGGGSAAPVAATGSFPLQAGLRDSIAAGSSHRLTVSGSCTGTATATASAPVPAVFEGRSSLAVTSNESVTLAGCTPSSLTTVSVKHYDTAYLPIGVNLGADGYMVVQPAATALPVSVRVGDAGTYAQVVLYSDASKATTTGRSQITYQVEADTADTAIVNLTTRSFNAADQLVGTQQTRYRITATGAMTLQSIEIQIGTLRLVMTVG